MSLFKKNARAILGTVGEDPNSQTVDNIEYK